MLKVCANHTITPEMVLQPMTTSDRAWCWTANDYAEGESQIEQLCVKFKNPDIALKFKETFEECQKLELTQPKVDTPKSPEVSALSTDPVEPDSSQGVPDALSLADKFKLKEGKQMFQMLCHSPINLGSKVLFW